MTELVITGLSVGYGRTKVLDGVTLPPLGAGTLVGVLGANGIGKSTLLRALAGLGAYKGQAELNREDLSSMGHARRAARVGYLPQALPQATSLVAYEAVVSACRAVRPDLDNSRVDAAVEQVFDQLGIRDMAFQALNKMSGGQRQMVGLAQIIVRRPAVMLLDEPTSALDLKWQLTVLDCVRAIIADQGGVCLMALHDINLAIRHCDRIALLGNGSLLAYGQPSDAVTGETLRAAYGIEGRIETCSDGRPFIVADGAARPSDIPPVEFHI